MDYNFYIILFSVIFASSVFLLCLPKIVLFFKNKIKKNKSKKQKKQKENDRVIYKSSQTQLRPVVKPPQIKFEEKKEDNEPTIEEEIEDIDNKLSSTTPIKINKDIESDFVAPNSIRLVENPNRAKAMSDLDKEFEEIRKFLEIPSEKEAKPARKFSDFVVQPAANKNKKNYDEIDYDDYIMGGEKPTFSNKNTISKDNNIKQKSKSVNTQSFVEVDGEKVDLNKLPTNLKKILISNVLSRKNFDD